jgi:hypothetical protein
MANTTKGVTYPTSSDNIAPLETHFENLALSADNAGIVSGSYSFAGPSDTTTPVNIFVAYGATLTGTPVVTANVRGGAGASGYVITISGEPLTTGFTARVHRISGSGQDSSLFIDWQASNYVA